MIYYENECCDCATDAYPCVGAVCPLRRVKHYACDSCHSDVEYGELFYFNGQELCISCIQELLEQVE